MKSEPVPTLNQQEVTAFLGEVFHEGMADFSIDHLDGGSIDMRLRVSSHHLRPGGTVSGPAMFGLADVAVYALILSQIGRVPLAVTTNCSIDFMRKPEANCDLIARAHLLKLGRSLAVADAHLFSEGSDKMVARATLTYSIPPKR